MPAAASAVCSGGAALPLLVVMGVSGAGKSLLSRRLADDLGVELCDGDDLHPPRNVAKMRGGTPLDDADRAPWLAACGAWLAGAAARGGGVLACSALKRRYREALGSSGCAPRFVLLGGDVAVLRARIAARAAAGGHYMPPALLDSQLAALEAPAPDEEAAVIRVDFALSVADASALVVRTLRAPPPLPSSLPPAEEE